MHTFFTSIHIPNILTFFTGFHPIPRSSGDYKIPRRRTLFSRTETDCQGLTCRKTACCAPLYRLPSASAFRSSSDGDLFILQSQRKQIKILFFAVPCTFRSGVLPGNNIIRIGISAKPEILIQ